MTRAFPLPKPSFPNERQAQIHARLGREGRVVAAELARDYDTSEDTIRRDLRDLAAAGLCRRVYGGALPVQPAAPPIAQRAALQVEVKTRLGQRAASLVQPGQLVFIDAGTTNLSIARALPDTIGLTVATNAPSVALALENRAGITVMLLGGLFDRRSGGVTGAKALRDAQHLRPDLYFVGTCAISPQTGVAVVDSEEAELKRALAATSGLVAAAATDDKLGTSAPFPVIDWQALDHLVVETQASLDRCGPAGLDGPRLHVADGDASC